MTTTERQMNVRAGRIHKRLSDIEKTYNDLFLICIGRISENVISY